MFKSGKFTRCHRVPACLNQLFLGIKKEVFQTQTFKAPKVLAHSSQLIAQNKWLES